MPLISIHGRDGPVLAGATGARLATANLATLGIEVGRWSLAERLVGLAARQLVQLTTGRDYYDVKEKL